MLSKNKIKFITSLHRKKGRDENLLFIAEGNKLVTEILSSDFDVETLVATGDWIACQGNLPVQELIDCSPQEMKKISALTTPSVVLAVVRKPDIALNVENLIDKLTLVLDDIRDPGNLGTIIRLCDWFGIENIVCSVGTVEVFNPKVIQATMGAILRVKVHYQELTSFFTEVHDKTQIPVYGTFMEGGSIFSENLSSEAIIVMGNEGKGISPEIQKFIQQKISIPSFSSGQGSESLNVAMSTGIVLSEFRRQGI